ncbi:hypothetical protein [Thalassovita taeanensis]|uniref:Uncharacterized protein n=1 Tax=Thalassovita taeanensis TaxID=657014 RepID=A0A1H9FAN4_9RHOB|nr:hypothetical protein [Thalassovita taeanensis]SEQ34959.1 hypothetical protein SAMN04488092_10612 [Thalassovita taeanensis]
MISDASQPLPDSRDEHFARMVAAGVGRARAYEVSYGGEDRDYNAWRQQGYRLGKKSPVRTRIEHLRTLDEVPDFSPTSITPAAPVPQADLSRAGLLQLMGEVTGALRDAARALDRAGGTPTSVARLRRDLLAHVKRVQKFEPAHAAVAVIDENFAGLGENLADLRCRCAAAGAGRTRRRV